MSLAIVIHTYSHFIVFNVLGPLCNDDNICVAKKNKTVQNEKWKCIVV